MELHDIHRDLPREFPNLGRGFQMRDKNDRRGTGRLPH